MGHGSHLSPDSSAPVYAHAEQIRKLGVFDEVLEAFWKEEPSLPYALDIVQSEEVWVVPVFLAEGYFTRQVVPRELGLDHTLTEFPHRRVHYCPPVGTHPLMADLILKRAGAASGLSPQGRRGAALLIIGHGTERSATSGDTVYRLVDRLREAREFGIVECGFLDEEPKIADVLAGLEAEDVVLVPFFVAEGWHTATTIPEELGLEGPISRRGGRTIWYTPPVGTLPEIADVIIALTNISAGAAQPGAESESGRDDIGNPGFSGAELPLHRFGFPHEEPVRTVDDDRLAFFAWVDSQPRGADFLEAHVRRTPAGRYELRHVGDAELDTNLLERSSEPNRALEIARFTSSGEYRPLRTAATLRRGWLLDLERDELWRAISLLYPATIPHWNRRELAESRSRSYAAWSGRQTGIYSKLRDLSSDLLPAVVQACCVSGRCLRTRLWRYDATLPLTEETMRTGNNGVSSSAVIPCPEPCTLFGTVAREILYARTTCESSSDAPLDPIRTL